MKINISDRERLLLIIAGLVLVFAFFYWVIFQPKLKEIFTLRQQLKEVNLQYKLANEKSLLLKNMEVTPLEKLRANKGKEEQILEALHYLAKEISRLDLNLLSIRPRNEERTVDLAKVVFLELTFTGKYNPIYKFMSALEKLPILIMVDSMTMSRGSDAQLSVNMLLAVYY